MHPVNDRQRKILVVTAHPDDETFGMGGTIARYTREGVQVSVVCATKGEAGEADPQYLSQYPNMAALREAEMTAAMKELGVEDWFFLGYRDSGMPGSEDNTHPNAFIQSPLEKAGFEIARYIRSIKPDIVLTFDPMGGYGHPDHIHTYRAVMQALKIAKDPLVDIDDLTVYHPAAVYLHTFSRKTMRIVVKMMPLFGLDPARFGKNADIDFRKILEEDFPIHARIRYKRVAAIREAASACYRSQGGDRQSGYFIGWLLRILNASETYMQCYPQEPPRRIKNDLFTEIEVQA